MKVERKVRVTLQIHIEGDCKKVTVARTPSKCCG